MSTSKKVLLVGWDAADWKMMHPLIDQGLMPNAHRLIENGVMANLATLSPVLSPMLWTSIATGKRPFKHGIHGFSEPTRDGLAVQPVTNLSRKTKAVWNILNQEGKRSTVVGWWPSHPAEPIDGVMVSNNYHRAPGPIEKGWPMSPGTVHPPRLAEELAELRVHPQEITAEDVLGFIPRGAEVDQDKDRRIESFVRVLADCSSIHSCATHLMVNEPWDFMAVYYDAIDHFSHGLMKYHPPRQEHVSEKDFEIYSGVMRAGYVYHDMMLGRLLELAGDDTTVILMSDHGFHPDHLRPRAIPAEPAGPAIEHRDFGIFVMVGPGIKKDEFLHGATLLDVAPTILTLFGLPAGDDMDGRPLTDAFQETRSPGTIPSWDDKPGPAGRHPEGFALDPEQARAELEQLVALGYIERPSEDREKAVAETRRELDYNLARAYMDGGLHGEAAELLARLYQVYPLEFRFGLQLALCLRALDMSQQMAALIEDLNQRWRKAAAGARKRLKEISEIAQQRRASRTAGDPADPAEDELEDKQVFSEAERRVIRSLRGIARGNERTLDYLASFAALANGRLEEALEYLREAEKSTSKAPGFYLQVGDTHLELKNYDDAEAGYRKVLELDPENPNAHLGLCRVDLRRRRNGKALDSARRAVGLKYQFPAAHYFLGIALHRAGDLHGAVEALHRAVEQNPNFAEAHGRLAAIYGRRFGDETRTKEHRAMAREIRLERRRQLKSRKLPELPPLDRIPIEENLPSFPEPPAEQPNLRPTLARRPSRERTGSDEKPFVTVVSGLPRSGTSMLMRMLDAGGLKVFSDHARGADESNPHGYFELERVKQLQTSNDWLGEASGQAVKVVAPLVRYLPQDRRYRVLFIERDLEEVRASQNKILDRLEHGGARLSSEAVNGALSRQLREAKGLLAAHSIPVLELSYADVLRLPEESAERSDSATRLSQKAEVVGNRGI